MVEKKIHHEVDAIQPLRSEELRLAVDQHDFPGLLLKQQITEPQVAMIFSVTLPSDAIHRPSADVVRQNWIDEASKCIARLVPVDGMFQCGFRVQEAFVCSDDWCCMEIAEDLRTRQKAATVYAG